MRVEQETRLFDELVQQPQLDLFGIGFGPGQLGHVWEGQIEIDDGRRPIRIEPSDSYTFTVKSEHTLPQEPVARGFKRYSMRSITSNRVQRNSSKCQTGAQFHSLCERHEAI